MRRLLPALAWQWAATLYCAAVSFGLSALLGRLLGAAGFGAYATLYTAASLLALLLDGGFRTLLLRERTAVSADAPALERLPGIALGHLVLVGGALLALSPLLGRVLQLDGLPAALLCFGMLTWTQWGSAWLRGAGEFARDARWQAGSRTLGALFILFGVWLLGASSTGVFLCWSAGLLAASLLLRTGLARPPARDRSLLAHRLAASFLVIDLFSTLYQRIDILLLHAWSADAAAVGRYAAAYRLLDGVFLLAAPVALLLFRRLRLARGEAAATRRFAWRALGAAAGLGAALGGGALLAGPWVLGWVFGAAFAGADGGVIRWLFAGLAIALPNSVLTQMALACQRERWFAAGAACALLVNLACNALWIPAHGALGAAWATLATEAALGLVLLCGLRGLLLRGAAS